MLLFVLLRILCLTDCSSQSDTTLKEAWILEENVATTKSPPCFVIACRSQSLEKIAIMLGLRNIKKIAFVQWQVR